MGPVAPLVQSRTAGVQHEGSGVLHNGELDLVEGASLRQGVEPVLLSQSGGHRLLYNGLAGGHGVEGRVEAVALDGELSLPGDKALPGQGLGALKQGVEIVRRERAQHQQHPLSGAQVQVEPGNVQCRAPAQYPAVLCLDSLQIQSAHLVGAQALQPKQGGHGKGQIIHSKTSRTGRCTRPFFQ